MGRLKRDGDDPMVRRLQLTDKSFYAGSTGRQFPTVASDERFQPQDSKIGEARPNSFPSLLDIGFLRHLFGIQH
jgi:hypothetical protein